jgi:hypothetical protein
VKKSNSESKVSSSYCEAAEDEEEEKHPRVLFYWTDPLDKRIKQTYCASSTNITFAF